MNLTLSADEELIRRMRQYAAEHGTSLNRVIREHMQDITGAADLEKHAREFARLATEYGGRSPEGFVFTREEAHRR